MTQITSNEALSKLLTGNMRFVKNQAEHPHQTESHRKLLCEGQKPFAVVLTCSDSRVPPELIFDQGFGDLFVIRVAGNILDDAILGSIEYAVLQLKVKLVVVLGHSDCGAVTAALSSDSSNEHIDSILKAIQPAIELARNRSGDILSNAIEENIKSVVEQLKTSQPVLANHLVDDQLIITGANYNLKNGTLNFM